MTRSKGKAKRILTQCEVAGLKDLKKEAEGQLREVENYGAGTSAGAIDKAKIGKEIAYLDKQIEEGKAPTVRGTSKDRLAQEARELESKFKEGLPTRYEMDHPSRCPGAVHKHLNWAKRNEQGIKRYKEIQRTLQPQDPTATDIERFRQEGRRRD